MRRLRRCANARNAYIMRRCALCAEAHMRRMRIYALYAHMRPPEAVPVHPSPYPNTCQTYYNSTIRHLRPDPTSHHTPSPTEGGGGLPLPAAASAAPRIRLRILHVRILCARTLRLRSCRLKARRLRSCSHSYIGGRRKLPQAEEVRRPPRWGSACGGSLGPARVENG